MKLPHLDAAALVRCLEASGVSLNRVSKTELEWSANRNLTPEEIQALKNRNDAVLDVLAARNLKQVSGHGSDVVPALRAMLSDYHEWMRDEPGYLAVKLYT